MKISEQLSRAFQEKYVGNVGDEVSGYFNRAFLMGERLEVCCRLD